MATLVERLRDVLAAFRADNPRCLDDLDALYAPDVRFEDPIQRVDGRAAFRRMNERLLARCAYVRFEDVALVGDDARVMATWTMIYKPKVGPEIRVAGSSDFRAEGGCIVYHRDYWDILGAVMSGFPLVEPLYKRVIALLG
jgi:limonene-1,2-epoxide hydrolase